jgi:Protein of unknown function (DUF433)
MPGPISCRWQELQEVLVVAESQSVKSSGKASGRGFKRRIKLGRYIVADSAICQGKPTFKGTRIMVWQVLQDVADGRSWDFICMTASGDADTANLPRPFSWAQELLPLDDLNDVFRVDPDRLRFTKKITI